MDSLAGSNVLLTGASGGIGSVVALALAEQGATVVGVARSAGKLERVFADVLSERHHGRR